MYVSAIGLRPFFKPLTLYYCIVNNLNQTEENNFDRKLVKLYKAMRIMEQSKHLEPTFSDAMKDLAQYLNSLRVSILTRHTFKLLTLSVYEQQSTNGETISRLSNTSNITGFNNLYKSAFGTQISGLKKTVRDSQQSSILANPSKNNISASTSQYLQNSQYANM